MNRWTPWDYILKREDAILKSRYSPSLNEDLVTLAKNIKSILNAGCAKVILFGNGGSAAQAQHLASELVGRFKKERSGYPAVALTTDGSVLTAIANDYGYEEVFARQVEAIGKTPDIAIAFSTSGKSKNVLKALDVCKKKEIYCVSFSSRHSSDELRRRCRINIEAPSDETAIIQELHLMYGHILCELIDNE